MTQLVTALQAAVQENPTPLRAKAVQKPKVPARQTLKRRSTTRSPQPDSQTSDSETDSSSDDADDESEVASVATNQVFRSRSKTNSDHKLPAFTGKEKWEVWLNRFEAVANLKGWDEHEKLQEVLPRLQGEAGDFAFDKMPQKNITKYKRLIRELSNRFGVVETARTYKLQFNRRKQFPGETTEKFAAELKRLYDKAHRNRDFKIRQEDLLSRFLLGLQQGTIASRIAQRTTDH